jgi:hypothetical protein
MFSTLRKKIGIPGVVAVVALVFAMAGGALAASGALTSKQKKEVTKIAKQYAGKPGATGPQGPAGTNGKDGAPGNNGAPGNEGAKGATGPIGATGKTGSTGATGSTGKTGNTGSTGEINTAGPLPAGQTETGAFAFTEPIPAGSPASTRTIVVPISFPIPLANELTFEFFPNAGNSKAIVVKKGASGGSNCPGSPAEPTAASGFLCVYMADEPEILAFPIPPNPEFRLVGKPGGAPEEKGTSKTGALLIFQVKKEQPLTNEIRGTWATTG